VVPRSIINSLSPGTTSVNLRTISRRDLLVRSALGGTRLSGPYSEGRVCHVRLSNLDDPPQFARVSVGTIHELPLPGSVTFHGEVTPGTTSVNLRTISRRDLLVRSALGGTRLSGPYSEGRVCHVRLSNLDDPPQFARVSVGTIHEWPLPGSVTFHGEVTPGTTSVPLRTISRRDPPVRSALGGTCLSGPSFNV